MPLPTAPQLYPRRVLVGVTGLSPQVITETLFALAVQPADGTPAFVPTEIHLITTVQGARQASLNLLSEQPGWFHRLLADYHLPPIRFDAESIHLMQDASGAPLEDIRSPADNEHAADCITRLMRELTADPDCALHVSIAGGRKTMGFYLGYALSLFARPQDRLSHVLVSSPYESHPEFFYPAPYQHILQTRSEPPLALDAAQAQVQLAEIPFVSLRHGLRGLIEGDADFGQTVAAAKQALEPASLRLQVSTTTLIAGGVAIKLPPSEFTIAAALAWRAMRGKPPTYSPPKEAKDARWAAALRADVEAACGQWSLTSGIDGALQTGVDGNWFSQHRSRMQRRIQRALGPAAAPYLVKSRRRDRQGPRALEFFFDLDRNAITFERGALAGKP